MMKWWEIRQTETNTAGKTGLKRVEVFLLNELSYVELVLGSWPQNFKKINMSQ